MYISRAFLPDGQMAKSADFIVNYPEIHFQLFYVDSFGNVTEVKASEVPTVEVGSEIVPLGRECSEYNIISLSIHPLSLIAHCPSTLTILHNLNSKQFFVCKHS